MQLTYTIVWPERYLEVYNLVSLNLLKIFYFKIFLLHYFDSLVVDLNNYLLYLPILKAHIEKWIDRRRNKFNGATFSPVTVFIVLWIDGLWNGAYQLDCKYANSISNFHQIWYLNNGSSLFCCICLQLILFMRLSQLWITKGESVFIHLLTERFINIDFSKFMDKPVFFIH